MPRRLIEIFHIGGQVRFRLSDTGSPEPYTALSYCWRGEQHVKNTIKTLSRYLESIDITDLPATVRDAIRVTERPGIRKIRIDAFCIVQDDPVDKACEMSQMPLVYSQATVTIAASRAKAVDEGFLHDRPRIRDLFPDPTFEMPIHCSKNKLDSVVLLPKIRQESEPLDYRGWALQERSLSARIIDFGSL
jgi:hypothetical protein